ncbi:hypothetical protein [Aestuariimicrobium sp. Y1814]|uniref:hypothetical protein n=1 Tax=Aestuariimicrobium sp. Y1814 TaxID=3418742 RepID=UPI003DA6E5D5
MIHRDLIPAACRAAREAVDGARDAATAAHLAGCESCRQATGEMQQVLDRLKHCSHPTSAPDGLSARLAAIAGNEADEPLWLASSGAGSLPSPRQRRRRTLATGSVALVACFGMLFTLGLLLAPTVDEVADARTTANREFDLSLGMGAGAQAVNAVMASAQGGRLSPTPTMERPGVMTSLTWTTVSQDQALSMLLEAVDPKVGYVGTQRVTLSGGQGFVSANVWVAQQPGSAVSVAVHDASGTLINSGVLPARHSDQVNSLPPSASWFRVARGGIIAGHPATLLEAKRADRSLVARWWVSPELGQVLWNETFDSNGTLVRSAGFTELRLTSEPPADTNPMPLQLSKAPAVVASATRPMCTDGFDCSSELAGFRLLSMSSDSPHNPTVIHAVYEKDGVCVTVLQQRGRLAEPAEGQQSGQDFGISTDRSLVTWQSGTVVYTVTTNAGPSVAQQVADELPHDAPAPTDPVSRSLSGLARLLGLGPR